MNASIKAFWVTLLVTTVSILLLSALASKLYGDHANFVVVLAIGSCIGIVTQPIFKRRLQMRAISSK